MIDYKGIKSLDDVPAELRQDPFFIINYFSQASRSPTDYKYLDKTFLSNKHFVYSVAIKNPEIYLMADNSIKNMDSFHWLRRSLGLYEYVQYAPPEFFENRKYVLKSIEDSVFNYVELPKDLREDKQVLTHVCFALSKGYSSFKKNDFKRIFKAMPKDYLMSREVGVGVLQGTYFQALGAMPEMYRKDVDLFKNCFIKNTSNLKYFDDSLINNYELGLELIKNGKDVIRNSYFDISEYYSILKNENLTDELCSINRDCLVKAYKNFDPERRANKNVLNNIFLGSNIDLSGHFIRMIPIDELRLNLINLSKRYNHINYNDQSDPKVFKEVKESITKLINNYFLKEDLHKSLGTKDGNIKKVKI